MIRSRLGGGLDDAAADVQISAVQKAPAFRRYFLVDYENVNREGLNGVLKLTENDCVRIYYSGAVDTLTFGLHRRINGSKAHFTYTKVKIQIKNAVDCQILFDLQELVKENRDAEYSIVSKDTDFDKTIASFVEHRFRVKRVAHVGASPEQLKTERKLTKEEEFFEQHFQQKKYIEKREEILEVLRTGKTRQQINNRLMKLYEGQTVKQMLKILQPMIKDLPGK